MASISGLLKIAVGFAVFSAPQGAQLLQSSNGMPPCKRCGVSGHSRDQLLAMEDGDLVKMKDSLGKEVDTLEKDLDALKEKHEKELGKLHKNLDKMNEEYKKFSEDSISRTGEFGEAKAKHAKALDDSLQGAADANEEIGKVHASMDEMRSYLVPYAEKIVDGSCTCEKAKTLLQNMQATLHLSSVDLGANFEAPSRRESALLRRSSRTSQPNLSTEHYKLVREVQQLEDKRAHLMQGKTESLTDFSTQQRITLDRINTAKIKADVKVNTEKKYAENDATLKKVHEDQEEAAGKYLDSAKSQLDRLRQSEKDSMEGFKEFKAALGKCGCL